MDFKFELEKIKEEIAKSEKKIEEKLKHCFDGSVFPDRLPDKWASQYVKLNIPYDYMELKQIKENMPKFLTEVQKYKDLRSVEAELLISSGVNKIEDFAPE